VLTLALALTLTFPAQGPALPARGVLVPGASLAGVRLGDTDANVRARLGGRFRVCRSCSVSTWYYTYPRDEPVGLGVTFRRRRVSAVFTLGAPSGWRTREGLHVGETIDKAQRLYGRLAWRVCIGYGALSIHRPDAVTSIYTTGEVVYGFALSRPSEPICQ
jgi:hypothetical protein